MAKTRSLLSTVRETLASTSDSVGFSKKDSAFVVKRTYFYRHGMTAEKLADHVKTLLPAASVVSARDYWKAWPATSYFEVRFTL